MVAGSWGGGIRSGRKMIEMEKALINIFLFFSILLFPIPGKCDLERDIAKCAAIDNGVTRLECFDSIAKKLGVDKPITKISTGKGKWNVNQQISQIDDSTNVFLKLESNELVESGYKKVRPVLVLRCAENKTNAYIMWNLHLGLDHTVVLIRFDKKRAQKQTWSISTNHEAIFVKEYSPIFFIKKLMRHNKLLVQLIPHGENPVMATFDIQGLSESIGPLKKACHWK